ncbi:MAG: polyhydroxybutyrate depolymerase [Actinobacteria bacterium]|nr:polyhydroxybutyrate depolymerase [Actinomycetota bacterium]
MTRPTYVQQPGSGRKTTIKPHPGAARPRRSLLVSVALVLLAACGGSDQSAPDPPPGPPIQRRRLDVGGLQRTYRLFMPSTLDRSRAAPLVLVLGGVGNSVEGMVQATQFDRMAQTGDFLVAYPEGINETWNAGYCCLARETTGPDDVAFLTRLIDDVQANNKVDPDGVFVVGVSVGGMMAYRMGCELADRIAGVGSVAGAMILDECRPSRPVSVIEIHGTADGLVPYEGGRTAGGATQPSPPTTAVVGRWAELNRCPTPGASHTEGAVTTLTWSGCAAGTSVKLVTIAGGGHTWFASDLGPGVAGAVDATGSIWAFLSGLPPRG